MTEAEITAAQDSVESAVSLITSMFGGNILMIFYVAAICAAWGVLAYITRRFTSVGNL